MDLPRHWLEDVWQDANHGLRLILRSPGFSFVAIAILAFGIAATAAIFSFVNSLIVRPLAIEDVGAVVQIAELFPGEAQRQRVAYANFSDWREQSNSFEQIAAFRFASLAFAVNSEPDQVLVMKATASIFPLLHARTAFGRVFTTDDDRPGAPSVAVLTNAFWQNHFGGDPNIIGQTARLDGHSAVVIGVLADDPDYFGLAPVWTPLALARGPDGRSSHFLSAVARLKSGVALSQARAELDLIASRLTDNKIDGRQLGVLVVPFQRSLVDFIYPALSVAMAAAGFLLLITCANVGNLVLARGTTRGKEIAIRIALGASRFRIVRQLLAESAVLSCFGAVIGMFLCRSAVKAIVAMSPENQRLVDIQVDWRVVVFIVLVTALTSIALGLLPALRNSQPARFARSLRLRNALIVAEVASVLVLLAGTGLLLKSYLKAQSVSPGMRIDGVLTVDFSIPPSKYPTNEDVSLFYSRVFQAMASVPGVQSASTVSTLPFAGRSNFAPFDVRGAGAESHDSHDLVNQQIVSANYFTTEDVKVMAGRAFSEHDSEKSQRVAVINKALAERFWKDRDPIGTEIRIGPPEWKQPWLTIIGVSANVMHYGLDQKVPLEIYQPFDQVPDRSSTLLLQTPLDPSELAKTIREKIFEIDRDQAVSPVRRMKDVVDESLWQRRVLLSIMLLFGGIGLILSSIALYGVIAYSVQRRQTEFGIRMALGARSRDILMLAMSEGMRLVAMGILIGLALASIAVRTIKSLLYDVSANDAATFGAILALLFAVSFIALYLPARRATGADPVSVLRID